MEDRNITILYLSQIILKREKKNNNYTILTIHIDVSIDTSNLNKSDVVFLDNIHTDTKMIAPIVG